MGDKLMPEMHLRQPEFTYSASRPFTKKAKKQFKNLKKKKKKKTQEIQDIFITIN